MNRWYALPLGLAALTACGTGDAGNWGGTITDSAGVAYVMNPAEGDWSVAPQPQPIQDLDIGAVEGEAAYQFGTVVAIDVNDAGEILVLDQQAAQVRIFDANGKHLRSVGKPGTGPGELVPGQTLMGMRAGRGDTVYVADLSRFRIVGLAGDGTEFGSYEMPLTQGIPVALRPAPGGKLAIQMRRMALPGMTQDSAPPRDFIIIRDLTGGTSDTVATLESGETLKFSGGGMQTRIFASEPMWAILDDGRVVIGRNDAYRLQVYTPDGRLERVIQRPVEPSPVTATTQAAYRAMLRKVTERQLAARGVAGNPQAMAAVEQMLKSMEFAEFFPVYANLLGGPDNTLWVQRFPVESLAAGGEDIDLESLTAPDWDVFDGQGRLLGRVTLPERFNGMRVVGRSIYGVQRDELDVQHVVRLTLQ
jgi:hypothetical protein